jgi:hypothetical protein
MRSRLTSNRLSSSALDCRHCFDHKPRRGVRPNPGQTRKTGYLPRFIRALEPHERTESMTPEPGSGTPLRMENAGLSRPSATKDRGTMATEIFVRCATLVVLFGAMNCENRTEAEQKPAASAYVTPHLEVPAAQPPKLMDQAVLPPPSLSPELLPGANASAAAPATSTAKLAPSTAATTPSPASAPAATSTARPKPGTESPGIRANTQTPGPMAPRTPKPAETM